MTTISEMITQVTPQQLCELQTHRALFGQLRNIVIDALHVVTACRVHLWETPIHTRDELLALIESVSGELLTTAQALKGLAGQEQR